MRSLAPLAFLIFSLSLLACSSTPPPEPGAPAEVEAQTIDEPDSSALDEHPCGSDRWDSPPPTIVSEEAGDDA